MSVDRLKSLSSLSALRMFRSRADAARKDGIVLEIGSGHRPARRSDILVDRYLEPIERTGNLVVQGKPLLQGAGEALPLRTASARYCLARQVLEHATDLEAFTQEMSRVAAAGLIETPSPLAELLMRPRTYHRWIVGIGHDGLLVYWPREALETQARFGAAFEALYERNPLFYLAVQSQFHHFITHYEWTAEIHVRAGSHSELLEYIERQVKDLSETPSRLILWKVLHLGVARLGARLFRSSGA